MTFEYHSQSGPSRVSLMDLHLGYRPDGNYFGYRARLMSALVTMRATAIVGEQHSPGAPITNTSALWLSARVAAGSHSGKTTTKTWIGQPLTYRAP